MRLPNRGALIGVLGVGLVTGCTGVTVQNGAGEMRVTDLTTEPNTRWDFRSDVTQITGHDRTGDLCAIIGTAANQYEAEREAIEDALESGSGYAEYRVYRASEFQGGECALFVRFGSDTVSVTQGRGVPEDAVTGEAEVDVFEFGLDIRWGWALFSGVYLGPLVRFAGGSWSATPVEGSAVPKFDTYVADMAAGAEFHFVPWWLFGVGLHTQGSWNLLSWDLGTRILLDFTYPFEDFAISVGMGNERQALGYADTRQDRDAPFFQFKLDFAGLMASVW